MTKQMGVLATLVILATPLAAHANQELFQKKNCAACHAVDKKIVGPALKDIAAKYKGDAGAVDKLAAKVIAGGSGVWGPAAMPPNPVSQDEAKTLVKWIMTQK